MMLRNWPTCTKCSYPETRLATSAELRHAFIRSPRPSLSQARIEHLYLVVHVYDGDTIACSRDGTIEIVRLIGIDAPELAKGRRPAQYHAELSYQWIDATTRGELVHLEPEPHQPQRDRYNRLLAWVYRWPSGLCINTEAVRTGQARHAHEWPCDHTRILEQLQIHARSHLKGMWSKP